MGTLHEDEAKRNPMVIRALTVVSVLVAIAAEVSIISHVWFGSTPQRAGFQFYYIPVLAALPCVLCLAMQFAARKAAKAGEMSPKFAQIVETFAGLLMIVAYEVMGDLVRVLS